MDTQQLIATVGARTDLSAGAAEVVVREVLHALARALPQHERHLLATALPQALGTALEAGRVDFDPYVDEHLFIGYLMTEHQTTGYWDKTAGGEDVLAAAAAEEIERRARAVLTTIAEQLPAQTLADVCAALPPVLAAWCMDAPAV